MNETVPRTKTRELLEVLAAIATGVAFVGAMTFVRQQKLVVILGCMGAWIPYVVARARSEPGALRAWGLRTDNIREAVKLPGAFALLVMVAISIDVAITGVPQVSWVALAILATYPVWGLFQQFFVQSLIARNLERLGVPRVANVLVTAGLFGLVHLPDPALVALCFGAGLVWTTAYLRAPNLLVLAVCHGWLGALVYYAVLHRDPLAGS